MRKTSIFFGKYASFFHFSKMLLWLALIKATGSAFVHKSTHSRFFPFRNLLFTFFFQNRLHVFDCKGVSEFGFLWSCSRWATANCWFQCVIFVGSYVLLSFVFVWCYCAACSDMPQIINLLLSSDCWTFFSFVFFLLYFTGNHFSRVSTGILTRFGVKNESVHFHARRFDMSQRRSGTWNVHHSWWYFGGS